MQLPGSVQELASVIGIEQALFLIGQLPRGYRKDNGTKRRNWSVSLYVPKCLPPDHKLVRLLGWHDANKVAREFGGEILQLSPCPEVYRRFRDASIVRLASQGIGAATLAEWFEVSDRHVRNLLREKPQEETRAANDNTSQEPISQRQAAN